MRRAESPWADAFNQPPLAPKPDKEQQAQMERFRAMMEPPPPEKPVVSAGMPPLQAHRPDPNMQASPAFNPSGNSFTAVRDSASRPYGITPLPPVTGVRPSSAPKPKPLVEPPPWVKDETKSKSSKPPETFVQRKF